MTDCYLTKEEHDAILTAMVRTQPDLRDVPCGQDDYILTNRELRIKEAFGCGCDVGTWDSQEGDE